MKKHFGFEAKERDVMKNIDEENKLVVKHLTFIPTCENITSPLLHRVEWLLFSCADCAH